MSFSLRIPGRLSALAALALLATASMAQTVDGKPEIKTEVLDRITSLLTNRAYVPGLNFAQWQTFVESEKAKLDESKNDEEFSFAVNEALTKFGASHIYFASPRAATARTSNSIVGIGITQQKVEEGTLIVRTVSGAPADKAGLVPGDIITTVDGKPADGPKGIAGEENTSVVLTVKHTDGKSQEYTLTRSRFSTKRVEELTEVDKNTAKLTVYTFDLSYDGDNVEKLMKQAAKYKNLILDLRDNGGGAVPNLQHLLGLFVSEKKSIGTFVSRRLASDYVDKTKGSERDVLKIAEWSRSADRWKDSDNTQIKPFQNSNVPLYKGHVAVLVNRFSGSASEMCAAALHDLIGAEIVGTKSAGAVLVSVIMPASNGFTLQYPINDYVTIKGLRIEGNGVVPTTEVEDPKIRFPNTKDPVVEKAAALLAGIGGRNTQ
jgi:carboxyl-terminal processing protease